MLLVLKKLQHEKQVIIIIILYVLSPMSAYCKLIQYGTPRTPPPLAKAPQGLFKNPNPKNI